MELGFGRAAHELKNMLSLIQGTLQLIENNHPEAGSYEYWGQLRDDVSRMNILIEEAAKLDRAGDIIKKRNNLISLLDEVVKKYLPICQIHKIKLCFTVQEAAKEQARDCCFDYDKLLIVFSNLLKNAIEACEQNDRIDILLDYISDRERACLQVAIINDGVLDGAYGKDIFEPFVTSKPDGTGLGLPMVKEISLAHGGDVEVSTDGQRTCFAVIIPYTK